VFSGLLNTTYCTPGQSKERVARLREIRQYWMLRVVYRNIFWRRHFASLSMTFSYVFFYVSSGACRLGEVVQTVGTVQAYTLFKLTRHPRDAYWILEAGSCRLDSRECVQCTLYTPSHDLPFLSSLLLPNLIRSQKSFEKVQQLYSDIFFNVAYNNKKVIWQYVCTYSLISPEAVKKYSCSR
jgi:hypothetical protein